MAQYRINSRIGAMALLVQQGAVEAGKHWHQLFITADQEIKQ